MLEPDALGTKIIGIAQDYYGLIAVVAVIIAACVVVFSVMKFKAGTGGLKGGIVTAACILGGVFIGFLLLNSVAPKVAQGDDLGTGKVGTSLFGKG